MTGNVRVAAYVVLAVGALTLPSVGSAVLAPGTPGTAAGLIGLGGLSVVLAAALAGFRFAAITSATTGVLGGAGVAADGQAIAGVAVMVAVAVALGVSARFSLQQATLTPAITVAFIVAEAPAQTPLSPLPEGLAFGAALAGYGLAIAALTAVVGLSRKGPAAAQPSAAAPEPSWTRIWGYVVALSVATIATTSIALTGGWGHTGGWLIMTPFIVMLPYVQDSWRKALRRAAGTVGGFAIAMGLAAVFGQGPVLTGFGVLFVGLTAYALVKKWPYAAYALVLTPAIVIVESAGRQVEQTAQDRLAATLLGVVIAIAITMAIYPIDRYFARRAGIEHF